MRAFFDELRRRGVAKAAAVYAVAAWAVIEASSVIFPALQLPEWTVTFVVVLALLGFPVTLTFAWAFDWTRQGIVRTPSRAELAPAELRALRRGRLLDFAVIAALLVVIGWLGWDRGFERDRGAAGALDSVAVLPFVNMSGDPDNEYFGDGLAEELLNALVRVDGLRVAARTSSFEYRDRNIDVRRIGEALNVAAVLEGSVRKAGERVRVTAQLIRSADGFHLWSDTFDASLEDIFAVQDRIALAIVDALRVTLGARARAEVTTHHTRDVEAFEAYLRGRFEMNRRTAASLERAAEAFRAAIARDPHYAAAYSGLSDSWVLRADYGGLPRDEALAQAEPMARRALALNPDLAEGHASLGLVLRNRDEAAQSVASFQRAIELNPSYSPAYHWLGLSYQQLGRFSDAVDVLRRAVEIDPQYVTGKRALLGSLRAVGRHDEADAYAERIAHEHANDPMLLYGLAGDALTVGKRVAALRHAARALRLAPENLSLRASVAQVLIGLGDIERADEQIDVIRRLNPIHPIVEGWPLQRALIVGDRDATRREAERRYAALPPGRQRDQFACDALLDVGRAEDARNGCSALLARTGWTPGEPVPPGRLDVVGTLLLAANELGDMELVDTLTPAFETEFERLRKAGLNADEVRWAFALIAAHAHGDTDELIAVLPGRLQLGSWHWRQLTAKLFAPVQDDPRFRAIVDEVRVRNERERAEAAAIEIPGL